MRYVFSVVADLLEAEDEAQPEASKQYAEIDAE